MRYIREFRAYMQNVSDADLLQAFEEFQEYGSDGTFINDGKLTEYQRVYQRMSGEIFPSFEKIAIEVMYEMSMRYFDLKTQ